MHKLTASNLTKSGISEHRLFSSFLYACRTCLSVVSSPSFNFSGLSNGIVYKCGRGRFVDIGCNNDEDEVDIDAFAAIVDDGATGFFLITVLLGACWTTGCVDVEEYSFISSISEKISKSVELVFSGLGGAFSSISTIVCVKGIACSNE